MKNFDENLNARIPNLEHWEPDNPRTCPTCRSLLQWFDNGKKTDEKSKAKAGH